MSDYASIPSTGKLKLKGVKDSNITKKKRPKKPATATASNPTTINTTSATDNFPDNSIMLRTLEDEDRQITKDSHRNVAIIDNKEVGPGAGVDTKDPELSSKMKTEAERRHDEQRRKRLEDRLKKEGVKTHKQRVEELNKYLSGLSEHHDMPKIGPG